MKRNGCTSEYERDRNKELLTAYRSLLARKSIIKLDEIWDEMAAMPASRFWVSEERAAVVVSHIMAGGNMENMHPMKRSMFKEIYRRFLELRKKHEGMTVRRICSLIVCQPAPSFYLTPASIRVIVYKIRRGWYERRKNNRPNGTEY